LHDCIYGACVLCHCINVKDGWEKIIFFGVNYLCGFKKNDFFCISFITKMPQCNGLTKKRLRCKNSARMNGYCMIHANQYHALPPRRCDVEERVEGERVGGSGEERVEGERVGERVVERTEERREERVRQLTYLTDYVNGMLGLRRTEVSLDNMRATVGGGVVGVDATVGDVVVGDVVVGDVVVGDVVGGDVVVEEGLPDGEYDASFYCDLARSNDMEVMNGVLRNCTEKEMKHIILYILCYSVLEVVVCVTERYEGRIRVYMENETGIAGHTFMYSLVFNSEMETFVYMYERFNSDLAVRRSKCGFNLLHGACSRKQNVDLFCYVYGKHPEYLLCESSYGTTPFHTAIQYDRMDIIGYICDKIPKTRLNRYVRYALKELTGDPSRLETLKYLQSREEIRCPICRGVSSCVKLFLPDGIELECPICNGVTDTVLSCGHVCCVLCIDSIGG